MISIEKSQNWPLEDPKPVEPVQFTLYFLFIDMDGCIASPSSFEMFKW